MITQQTTTVKLAKGLRVDNNNILEKMDKHSE